MLLINRERNLLFFEKKRNCVFVRHMQLGGGGSNNGKNLLKKIVENIGKRTNAQQQQRNASFIARPDQNKINQDKKLLEKQEQEKNKETEPEDLNYEQKTLTPPPKPIIPLSEDFKENLRQNIKSTEKIIAESISKDGKKHPNFILKKYDEEGNIEVTAEGTITHNERHHDPKTPYVDNIKIFQKIGADGKSVETSYLATNEQSTRIDHRHFIIQTKGKITEDGENKEIRIKKEILQQREDRKKIKEKNIKKEKNINNIEKHDKDE